MSDVTRLLDAIGHGDSRAAEQLLPLVYGELRNMARARMARERDGHTLQATALVHEVYMRLVGRDGQALQFQGRSHFFAAAAEAMRRILVDHARRKQALKHGGEHRRVQMSDDDSDMLPISSPCDDVDDLLTLNDALDRFAKEDPPKAELVKLLYFAGLNLEEAAEVLGISRTTAHRHWVFARAWLYDAIGGEPRPKDR